MSTPEVKIVDPARSDLENIQLQVNQRQNDVIIILFINY